MLNLGVFGVELFFVLSGFLIGGILIKTFVAADNFTPSEVGSFWIRRWFRTLPNYWLILTICFVVLHAMGIEAFHSENIKGYFFLQNLRHPNMLNAFPEGWSLSVEEWFYLTLPVLMFIFSAIFRPANKSRFLLIIFAAYLLVFVILRFVNAFQPLNGLDPDEGIRKVVAFRLDAVMYGVLFAWLNYFRPQSLRRLKGLFLAGCIVGFSTVFYLCLKYRLQFWPHEPPPIQFLRDAFLYLAVPLFLSCCLPFASKLRRVRSERLGAMVQHVSRISYSMYLVHYSLIFRPFFMPVRPGNFGTALIYYVLYWSLVIIGSSLLYRFFELPVMNLRDKIRLRRSAAGA